MMLHKQRLTPSHVRNLPIQLGMGVGRVIILPQSNAHVDQDKIQWTLINCLNGSKVIWMREKIIFNLMKTEIKLISI